MPYMYVQFSAMLACPAEKTRRTSSSSDWVEVGLVSPSTMLWRMNSSACTPPPCWNAGLPAESRNVPPKAPSSWA